MQAIVVSIVDVDRVHALFELLLGHHFADVLQDELARFQRVAAPHAPALLLRHETFQSLRPQMALNALIGTLIADGAQLDAAFGVHHPVETVVPTETSFIPYFNPLSLGHIFF